MKNNKKTKNLKLTNLVMSLGVATTIAGTIAAGIEVSKTQNNKAIVSHDLGTTLKVGGNSKVLPSDAQLAQLGITAISEDGNGGFYVGGKNSLFEHFGSDGILLTSKDIQNEINFDITSITLDSNGGVIISGSNAAQVHLDSKGNILNNFNLNNPFKIQGAVSKSLSSKGGQTYVVGTHGLVSIFDINGVELKALNLGQDVNVNAMIETNDSIVLGTEQGGLFFINKITNKVSSTQVNSPVVAIQENGGGVFVQTETKSLEVSNNNEILNSQDLNIFKNAKVTNIVSTEKGYIATGIDGHVALLDKSFKAISQSIALQGKDISSIVKDDESGFYIAGDKGLVSHINSEGVENSKEIKTLLDGSDIYGMQRNDQGHIFVFGDSFKVAELDNQGKTIKHFNLLGISSINTVTTKADGEVIFGGEIKTTKVWDTRIESETTSESPLLGGGATKVSGTITPTLLQNNNNDMLVNKFDYDFKAKETLPAENTFAPLASDGSVLTNGGNSPFLEDSRGNFWTIGQGTPLQFSSDGGISWKVDAASNITVAGGVNSIFEDNKGFIWIIDKTTGLNKFTYNSSGKTGTWAVQDQTKTGSKIAGEMGSIFQDSRGTLWTASAGSLPQKYDYTTGQWTQLDATKNKIQPPTVRNGTFIYYTPKLFEDSRGTLWYGDAGVPLQKSTDGGATWSPAGGGSNITSAFGLTIFEDSHGLIWAAGAGTPFQKSLDGGETWIAGGTNCTGNCLGFMFEDSHGILWSAGYREPLKKSLDGGLTWTDETTNGSNIKDGWGAKMFEDSSGELWSSSNMTPLQKYDYGTKTWTTQTVANSGNTITNGFKPIFYEDSKHNLWSSGWLSGLQVKAFGSDEWSTQFIEPVTPKTKMSSSFQGSIFTDSQNRMWMMGGNSTLEMSIDNGYTWVEAQGDLISGAGKIIEDTTTKTLYAMVTLPLAPVPTRPAYATAHLATATRVSKSVIFKLENGAKNWRIDKTSNIKDATFGVMTKDSQGTIWSISEGTKLQYLKPGAKSWVEDTTSPITGTQGAVLFEDSRKRFWTLAGSTGNLMWYTDDFGANWKSVPTKTINPAGVRLEEVSGGRLWLSTAGTDVTFFSDDGGNTWTKIDQSSLTFKTNYLGYGYLWYSDDAGPIASQAQTLSYDSLRFYKDTYGTTWAITTTQGIWVHNMQGGDYHGHQATSPIYKSADDGKTWVLVDNAQMRFGLGGNSGRTFYEDSQGTLWISNIDGIHYSVDHGATWILNAALNSRLKWDVAKNPVVNFQEDGSGRMWIFIDGAPPQYLYTKQQTHNEQKEIKGSFQVNALMKGFKMNLGFVGVKALAKLGIIMQYTNPAGQSKTFGGSFLAVDKPGTYTFHFVLGAKAAELGITNADLPKDFSVTFGDGDGIITNPKLTTDQPKFSGDLGTFKWEPFINPLHARLEYSMDNINWVDLPEEGGTFDKQNPGAEMQYKWVLDPQYTWASNPPTAPATQIILGVGIGDLEKKSEDSILKQITDWMDNGPFDFSKYTQFGFNHSCPDAKQSITVVSSTKITGVFDFSLVATDVDKFHYEITGFKMSDSKGPVAETLMPKIFAKLKALTHEFTIKEDKLKFKTISELIAPVLNSEFRVDPTKLPSTLIDAKPAVAANGFYTYTDPGNAFTIVFKPNNEEGKVHYSVTETGDTNPPFEDDIDGFYSYKKMGASLAPSNIVKLLETQLNGFDFKEYTKELFNAASNKANQTKIVVYKLNGYTLDFTFSIKATKQDELEYTITTFDVKDGTKVLASALQSPELKPISTTKDTMKLESGNKFTTFQEMLSKILQSDGSKIASQAVEDIPKIVAPTVAASKSYTYTYPKFTLTLTADNSKQCVNWSGVATGDPTINAKGVVGGFHEITNISTADFKTILLSSGWYDLDKLPSLAGQPTTGDLHKVQGVEFKLTVSSSDILGEMTVSGEYDDQVGTNHKVGPIKIFGFKDLCSGVTVADIKSAVESKLTSIKTHGIFDRTTTELPSEVYIGQGGYEIKVIVHYSFVDGAINYEAFLPNGNSIRNSLKTETGSSAGYASESKDTVWDPSGIIKPEDTLGDIIKAKLKAASVSHDQLPSAVKITIGKISMERGFDFSVGPITNAFAGYTSKKINSQYIIVYNNTTKDLQVIDTVAANIVGKAAKITNNLINAFSYDSTHAILIETGAVSKCAHVQLLNLSTGVIEDDIDIDNGITGTGLLNVEQISPGKFIYQDSTKKLHFLFLDTNAKTVVANEEAIIDSKDATILANFNLADLAIVNPLPNGNFVVVGNNQYYEVKIDGITISIVNKQSTSVGVQVKQIGDNRFLLEDGTKMYVAQFTSGRGFIILKSLAFAAKVDLSNAIRINDEYVVIKNGTKIYKINIDTAEVIDITPVDPAELPTNSNLFVNMGNRGILYPTATGTEILKVLTDGFYETVVSTPKADDSAGALKFEVKFLGKTVTFADTGYYKKINADSKDIPSYLKITGDDSTLNIDESGIPQRIAAHAHLEYSLDGTTWKTLVEIMKDIQTPTSNSKISDLQARYKADQRYIIQDTNSVKLFKPGSTIETAPEQKILDDIPTKVQAAGSVVKTTLSNLDDKLFMTNLKTKGLELMIRIGGVSGIWTKLDVTKDEVDLPQIFDSNGINQGVSSSSIRYSLNELYDGTKLSIDLKIQPIDSSKRMTSQKIIHITDYSHINLLTKIKPEVFDKTKVVVSGESGKLLFETQGAINSAELHAESVDPSKISIEYSLTGGKTPTESMLREIFGLSKTEKFPQSQNLITLFTKYQWFSLTEFNTKIQTVIANMNINANSIMARFTSKDPNLIIDQKITEPFKTSGTIIIYRDVSKLSGAVKELENHLVGSKYNLKVQLTQELLPEELAKYGTKSVVRDGEDTIIDKTFGMLLQYSTEENPKNWITIRSDEMVGNTFAFPRTKNGIEHLSMRLKPIEVTNGAIYDWNHIQDSTDRTLISNPPKPEVKSTPPVKIELTNIEKITIIENIEHLHFNLEGGSLAKTEPDMPTYKIEGTENGHLVLTINKNKISSLSDVLVQWLRPIENKNGPNINAKTGQPVIGYEMYAGISNGKESWIKVAEVKNGILKWLYIDYNNLPGSWITPDKVKLSVGDHLRFRLHSNKKGNQFQWSDYSFNDFSELVYSDNEEPKTNQDGFGVSIGKITFAPSKEVANSKIIFKAQDGKDYPQDWSEKAVNSINPKVGDKWMWHYTLFDGNKVIGEYDNKIPDNILKYGMVIKMKIISIDESVYKLDETFENKFDDITASWWMKQKPSIVKFNIDDFKVDGITGKGRLIRKTPHEIQDAKLLYRVVEDGKVIETTHNVLPVDLKNGEDIVIVVDPSNENNLVDPREQIMVPVSGLEHGEELEDQLFIDKDAVVKAPTFKKAIYIVAGIFGVVALTELLVFFVKRKRKKQQEISEIFEED